MARAWAYYNDIDPFAAAWLRELIADGLIAPGEVDERSIEDVAPDDLRGFVQCHFCAGIGVWSLAARLAGIPDDAPLWSASFPCQPFSAAGKGGGFADERHIWPAGHYLIEQCRPPVIVGEQVAGADGDAWLDLVSADLDATGYAFGAVETCAAGFGAPHIRSRNYWVGVATGERLPWCWTEPKHVIAGAECAAGGLDDGQRDGRGAGRAVDHARDVGVEPDAARADRGLGHANGRRRSAGRLPIRPRGQDEAAPVATGGGAAGGLAVDDGQQRSLAMPGSRDVATARGWIENPSAAPGFRGVGRPGPVNGFWGDADWLFCRDDSWRPVEPGSFPLADAGAFRNRVGLLRGSGNAITVGQAEGFLRAVVESLAR